MNAFTVHGTPARTTRYKELCYVNCGRELWRFMDAATGKVIGPYYATKSELLADLERYAAAYGCEGATDNRAETVAMIYRCMELGSR